MKVSVDIGHNTLSNFNCASLEDAALALEKAASILRKLNTAAPSAHLIKVEDGYCPKLLGVVRINM